jgi:hypothetical protein
MWGSPFLCLETGAANSNAEIFGRITLSVGVLSFPTLHRGAHATHDAIKTRPEILEVWLMKAEALSRLLPRSLKTQSRWLPVILVGVLSLGAVGCQTKPSAVPQPMHVPDGPIQPQPVSDEQFGASVLQLLKNPKPSLERQALLAGVVQRQLLRAEDRFLRQRTEEGIAHVIGALLLVRMGEMRPEMIAGPGSRGLSTRRRRKQPRPVSSEKDDTFREQSRAG